MQSEEQLAYAVSYGSRATDIDDKVESDVKSVSWAKSAMSGKPVTCEVSA